MRLQFEQLKGVYKANPDTMLKNIRGEEIGKISELLGDVLAEDKKPTLAKFIHAVEKVDEDKPGNAFYQKLKREARPLGDNEFAGVEKALEKLQQK
jgi:hypothetical protein